jgi:KRAB domain-containing zinc finger protein
MMYLSALKEHMFRHSNDYPYLCDIGFICHSALTVHKRVHIGERLCICNVCDKCFTQKGALKTHQLVESNLNAYQVIHTEDVYLCVLLVTNHSNTENILADTFPCAV